MSVYHDTDRLFVRHPQNPVLHAGMWPYPVHSVFNPGVARLPDGHTLLLCRCESRTGQSHMTAARSADGVAGWEIDGEPTFAPDPLAHPEEKWGAEDARITYLEEIGKYAVAYAAYGEPGAAVALALTEDFRTFERLGVVSPAWDKDAALLPRRIGGKFRLIHRPMVGESGDIWMSESEDLRTWTNRRPILRARRGGWWDADKIGLSPPPVETERGWLMLYHGVRRHASGSIYRLGLALFDLERPDVCLRRGRDWVMGPQAPYEIEGDVPYVVFPCGTTLAEDGDTLNVYYGAADTCVGLATASIRELLAWVEENGTDDEPVG
ncbi:MAG: glycosidase [Fimbriimonadaceae bacterium]